MKAPLSVTEPVSVLSIDVEDWFHILDLGSCNPVSSWGALESRVERNFTRLLDLCEEYSVHATCFFLGWVAERHPSLVKLAASRGHEIASHGSDHQLVTDQTEAEFYQDIVDSKRLLEDLCGNSVSGYRAPGFSIDASNEWAMDCIGKAGFLYDASLYPGQHAHGGSHEFFPEPHWQQTSAGELIEFPMTTLKVPFTRLNLFGGGYLRLAPEWLIHQAADRVHAQQQPVIYYIHPRDIDTRQPRLTMSALRRFKSYVNLHSTEQKLRSILRKRPGSFRKFGEMLNNSGLLGEDAGR